MNAENPIEALAASLQGMTVILRPVGRGNWKPVTLRMDGPRTSPVLIAKEDRISLGGITFRVVAVTP